jgi:subtilisin family serine protease
VIKVFKASALCAGITMALAAGSVSAVGPDENRVWVKFKPGSKAQVENALRGAGAQFHYAFDDLNAFAVSLPPQARAGIERNPNVEYVEQDPPRYPMAQTTPYGITMVQSQQAWNVGATGAGVTVCVIDSGLHTGHEDFAGVNIIGGHPSGWNTDGCGHGTHVAGTIAAANNGVGVVGVSPGAVNLYILKVFSNTCGWSYSSGLVDAANRCANAGARVINMSLGGGTSSNTERNAFQNLFNSGVINVAAAGNSGNTQMSYPASYDAVISVAAIDASKNHASFSQRNSQVELAAPGVSVLSTLPFRDAAATVDGTGYIVSRLDGTPALSRSGNIVSGGRCTSNGGGSFNGRVVLCERGDISFANKVQNVQSGGGVAAIIYNNEPGGFTGTLGGASTSIPSVSMTQEDGQFLLASKMGTAANVDTRSQSPASGYGFYDGTSMASPHVAGVAALVLSANPDLTSQQVREILASTAEDLGAAGRDNLYGWGLVRAYEAVAAAVGGGGGSEPPPPPPPSSDPVVSDLTMTFTAQGPNRRARATVSVTQDGQPKAGSSVNGCFSGSVSGCGSGTTNSSGQITFQSGNFRPPGTVTFCVTGLDGQSFTTQHCVTGSP